MVLFPVAPNFWKSITRSALAQCNSCGGMQSCQQNTDTAFVIAILVPIVTAVASIAWIARSPPVESIDDGKVFEDPDTGAIFTSAEGVTPERDRQVCDHSDR
jgi:hypothetical protein